MQIPSHWATREASVNFFKVNNWYKEWEKICIDNALSSLISSPYPFSNKVTLNGYYYYQLVRFLVPFLTFTYVQLQRKYARLIFILFKFFLLVCLWFHNFLFSLLSMDFPSASFGLCLNWPSFLFNQIFRNQFITIKNDLTSFISIIAKNSFLFLDNAITKNVTWPVKDNASE